MFSQTKIIAHRGYWNTDPVTAENSIASLQNAQKIKVYGSEFDIRMTKDKVLIISHDPDHAGMKIAETNYNDLIKAPLKNGEKIPTLSEYLEEGKKVSAVKMILEIKPVENEALENETVSKVLQTVQNLNMENQCEYISFSINICKEIKRQNPKATVQYLNGNLSPKKLKELGIDGLDYHYAVLTLLHPKWIRKARKLGLITNSWTVNSEKMLNKLIRKKVDFVTTNNPENFQKIISNFH